MNTSTPESLLDAAEALFSAEGYDAVGIREIADLAGANIASIRYHFGGKRELYTETVRRAMQRKSTQIAWQILEGKPTSRRDAAERLARFIRTFLDGMIVDAGSAACAQLLLREASAPSEAFEIVVSDFIAPHLDSLGATIAVIDSARTPRELERLSHFVLGLLVHHHHFRVFIEHRSGSSLDKTKVRQELADEMARFSLRGLRAGETFIEGVIESARRAAPKSGPKSSNQSETSSDSKSAPSSRSSRKKRASAPSRSASKGKPA